MSLVLILILVALLAGAAIGVLALVSIGIHIEEHRNSSLRAAPSGAAESGARRLMGVWSRSSRDDMAGR